MTYLQRKNIVWHVEEVKVGPNFFLIVDNEKTNELENGNRQTKTNQKQRNLRTTRKKERENIVG